MVAPRWNSFLKKKTKPRIKEKEPKQKPTAPKELGQRQMPSKTVDGKRVDKKPKKNGREKCGQKYDQKTIDKSGQHIFKLLNRARLTCQLPCSFFGNALARSYQQVAEGIELLTTGHLSAGNDPKPETIRSGNF